MRKAVFRANGWITTEILLRAEFDAMAELRATLTQKLSGNLVGPRGGHYIALGPIRFVEEPGRGFDADRTLVQARVVGRYVRPRRGGG